MNSTRVTIISTVLFSSSMLITEIPLNDEMMHLHLLMRLIQ